MFEPCFMLLTSLLRVLQQVRVLFLASYYKTYVSTYDNNASEVLARPAPTQSTSVANLFPIEAWDGAEGETGNDQMPTAESSRLAAPPI